MLAYDTHNHESCWHCHKSAIINTGAAALSSEDWRQTKKERGSYGSILFLSVLWHCRSSDIQTIINWATYHPWFPSVTSGGCGRWATGYLQLTWKMTVKMELVGNYNISQDKISELQVQHITCRCSSMQHPGALYKSLISKIKQYARVIYGCPM